MRGWLSRTRQERNKWRTITANGYPHKGGGTEKRTEERGKRKTQEEPGKKGTNKGKEQPMVTHIKGENKGRKERREKPKRNQAGKEQI